MSKKTLKGSIELQRLPSAETNEELPTTKYNFCKENLEIYFVSINFIGYESRKENGLA